MNFKARFPKKIKNSPSSSMKKSVRLLLLCLVSFSCVFAKRWTDFEGRRKKNASGERIEEQLTKTPSNLPSKKRTR